MPDSETSRPPGLRDEISSSLSSLWNQYAGQRPGAADTVIEGNRVTCVLTDSVAMLNDGLSTPPADESGAGDGDGVRRLTSSILRNDEIAAVKRVTGRRVVAFVSDHNAKTDVATEVFRLEAPPRQPM